MGRQFWYLPIVMPVSGVSDVKFAALSGGCEFADMVQADLYSS